MLCLQPRRYFYMIECTFGRHSLPLSQPADNTLLIPNSIGWSVQLDVPTMRATRKSLQRTPSSAKKSDSDGMLHTYVPGSNVAAYRWVGKATRICNLGRSIQIAETHGVSQLGLSSRNTISNVSFLGMITRVLAGT